MPLTQASKKQNKPSTTILKTLTGIKGLDEITGGGIPKGRPTLICGAPGAGKTLFSVEFIVRGATQYKEPGIIMTFEEKSEDLEKNVESLGFDLKKLQKDGMIKIDHVHIDRSEIEETGAYDLDGLFIRLGYAIDTMGAKRVVLDTIENLFGSLTNAGILRAEIRRLFTWLKDKGVTTIITGEKGNSDLTRQGLEEYVSDCVILLDHRVEHHISTRLLRIVKYRGSFHGTNEYPFLIDGDGISVMPVTSIKLAGEVFTQRISTGIKTLDNMLGGKGFFRGSSILISGTAGTGKSSIAAAFANASCMRKERALYFAFEESAQQIIRNMQSINLPLDKHIKNGLLQIHSARPTTFGLEMHLMVMYKHIKEFKPKVVVLDPITNLVTIGSMAEVKSILIRLIDFLQSEGVTVIFTALLYSNENSVQTDEGISSLVDAWILLRDIEMSGERNRALYVIKSRGMQHSNQIREFLITDSGIEILDVELGTEGVLVGSARIAKQLSRATGAELRTHAASKNNREIERKKKVLDAKIVALKEEFESVQDEINKVFLEEELTKQIMEKNKIHLENKRSNQSDGKRK